jgi:hypothetical protein
MTIEEDKSMINYTKPISESDAEKLFKKMLKIKMADILVDLFKKESDPKTFRHKGEYSIQEIYSNLKYEDINGSMIIRIGPSLDSKVNLHFYNSHIDGMPPPGYISVFCSEIAYVVAGPLETGVWALGRGNEAVNGISIHMCRSIDLPSKTGKWFLDTMSWLALTTQQRYQDLSKQPRFFIGSKEEPEY